MAGYTRYDTSNNIATGNVINAADLDGEFDALVAAFSSTTGHTHDGTAANGAPITKLGPSQEYAGNGTSFFAKTTGVYDLGTTSLRWNNAYLSYVQVGSAAAEDGFIINGRSGGTSSYKITLSPAVLSASRAIVFPDNSGTVLTTGATVTVAQGGTGLASLTANNVVLGNGTSAVQFVAPGTNGNVLQSNGTTWVSASGLSLTSPVTLIGNSSAGSEIRLPEDTDNGANYIAIKAPNSIASNRVMTLPDPEADATLGYLDIPQNSKSAAYTLVISDAGKHILHPSADTTARTFTIPANSSVAFPIGTAVTFINQNGAGTITISITTDTLRLAGQGTTGNRTLTANGIATCVKVTSTEWIISGTGLS